MGKSRFVTLETVRLPLSEGDWIRVKKQLSYGEQQAMAMSQFRSRRDLEGGEQETIIDLRRFNITRFCAWIVEWSFVDSKDNPVEVSEDSVAALSLDTAREIDAILDKHIEEVYRELGNSSTADPAGETTPTS